MNETIDRLTDKCERLNRVYQSEKARGAGLGVHPCAHCKASIKLRYALCFKCMQTLPDALRREITRNNPNARERHWRERHWRAVETAVAYLAQDDRAAYTREQAERGVGWAIDALMDAGELDYNGMMAILKRQAKEQGE